MMTRRDAKSMGITGIRGIVEIDHFQSWSSESSRIQDKPAETVGTKPQLRAQTLKRVGGTGEKAMPKGRD